MNTATNLLNSKAEHRHPVLLRVRMVQGDENDMTVLDKSGEPKVLEYMLD